MTTGSDPIPTQLAYGQEFLGGSGQLTAFIVGFPNYNTDGRAQVCYIYDIPLADSSQIGEDAGLVATSEKTADGEDFGEGGYSRAYQFKDATLQPNTTYYAYFSTSQEIRMSYDDGGLINAEMEEEDDAAAQYTVIFD